MENHANVLAVQRAPESAGTVFPLPCPEPVRITAGPPAEVV